MKKIIKKQGNSLVVIITREDREIHGFKEGDLVDVKIKKINKEESKKS